MSSNAMSTLWLRGSLHAHSTTSDGDSPPDVVTDWYRRAGYDFLTLTDHNELGPEGTAAGGLLLIAGEEVSASAGGLPVHVNAFGSHHRILPILGDQTGPTLAANVAISRAAGAVTAVNHPNYRYALGLDDLLDAGGAPLLEIFNGHPAARNEGDANHPSVEQLWGRLPVPRAVVLGNRGR